MRKLDLFVVLIPFVKREIDDPAQLEAIRLDQAQLIGDAGSRQACELGGLGRFACREEQAVVGAKAELRIKRLHAFLPVVFGNWAAEFARFARDIAKPRMTFAARPFVHLVKELAALVRSARCRDHADHAAAADNLLKQAKTRGGEVLRDIGDDQRIAQIGLVRAIFEDGIVISDSRKCARRGYRFAIGEGFEHAANHRLHRFPHFFLRDEAHFQIELVKLAGQPISARVFIAEARRDLEIAIKTRDHEQLLILLRRLRQRIELARMDAAGHEEIARAFGRRGGEDRG